MNESFKIIAFVDLFHIEITLNFVFNTRADCYFLLL